MGFDRSCDLNLEMVMVSLRLDALYARRSKHRRFADLVYDTKFDDALTSQDERTECILLLEYHAIANLEI